MDKVLGTLEARGGDGVDLKGIDKNFYREKEMLPPLLPPFILDSIWAHLSVNWQNRNTAAASARSSGS